MLKTAWDQKLHQNVSQNLSQMGHSQSTAPTTSETPLPLTPELKKIGATSPGLDTPLSSGDISFALKSALKPLQGGSFWARLAKGIRGVKIWKQRKESKELQGRKDDPGQLDIGE